MVLVVLMESEPGDIFDKLANKFEVFVTKSTTSFEVRVDSFRSATEKINARSKSRTTIEAVEIESGRILHMSVMWSIGEWPGGRRGEAGRVGFIAVAGEGKRIAISCSVGFGGNMAMCRRRCHQLVVGRAAGFSEMMHPPRPVLLMRE